MLSEENEWWLQRQTANVATVLRENPRLTIADLNSGKKKSQWFTDMYTEAYFSCETIDMHALRNAQQNTIVVDPVCRCAKCLQEPPPHCSYLCCFGGLCDRQGTSTATKDRHLRFQDVVSAAFLHLSEVPKRGMSCCLRIGEEFSQQRRKFAGIPFQQGISDSHSVLEFSEKEVSCVSPT